MGSNAQVSSEKALELLKEGNHRFANGLKSIEPMLSAIKLKELAQKGQTPFAVVLTCSDSRIPTEIVFDRGIGDLFIIRIAGNIVGPSMIASVEFAVSSFETPLCLVMGHTECGAIKAAVSSERDGKKAPTPCLDTLVQKIMPAVRTAKSTARADDPKALIHAATLDNVELSVRELQDKSEVIRDRVKQGKLLVTGALFDLHTGVVEFDPPGGRY